MAVYGYSRKHAIKVLKRRGRPRVLKKSGPKPIYAQEEIAVVLKGIWFGSDQLCGKRLKAALPEWLPHYEKECGGLSEKLKEKLRAISAATIDRLLAQDVVPLLRLWLSSTAHVDAQIRCDL